MLIVELITLNVRDKFTAGQTYYIFATTTIGSDTVKHPIGMVSIDIGAVLAIPVAGIMESFQRTIYADQETDIVFTVVAKAGDDYPVDVTFSGRLIDVP